MKTCRVCFFVFVSLLISKAMEASSPQQEPESKDKPVSSRVETMENGDIFLTQEALINAPLNKVWEAYTTSAGWSSWVAPVATVDFKIGGEIRTNYNKDGTTDDEDINVLHIVNYVPERLITLQAQVRKNWPDVLKEQEKRLFNIVTFERLGDNKTKVTSIGIGYKDTPELQNLLKFFVPANEETLQHLIDYVENGKSAFEAK